MKSILQYINESSSQFLTKLDLSGIPESDTPDYEIGKNQEKFIIDRLNEAYPEYKWLSIKDFYGDKYNTRVDLVDGDIVGTKDGKGVYFIDAKVASKNTKKLSLVGVINLNSIVNFGEDNKHYYLCINRNGSNFVVKKSKEIKDLFNSTEKCLKVSNNEDRDKFIEKSFNKYLDKFIDETENVSRKDYMPSFIFNK